MITIKNIRGEILYISSKKTIKEALQEAIKKKVNLQGANLVGANLSGANLKGVDLEGTIFGNIIKNQLLLLI